MREKKAGHIIDHTCIIDVVRSNNPIVSVIKFHKVQGIKKRKFLLKYLKDVVGRWAQEIGGAMGRRLVVNFHKRKILIKESISDLLTRGQLSRVGRSMIAH